MKNFSTKNKSGFTLAEVLITLAVIGIVAALTIPNLVQKYKRLVVENKLKKFYVNINQAVQMAEIDYGDKKNWYQWFYGYEITDEAGNPIPGIPEKEKWFRKYLAPYLKYDKVEFENNMIKVTFYDGTILTSATGNNSDWHYYVMSPDKCMKLQSSTGMRYGIGVFLFSFIPNSNDPNFKCLYNMGFEPYKYKCVTDIQRLKRACYNDERWDYTVEGSAYCTLLIQQNGWKIPDDYPFKF